ncbi:hypothetical protein FRC17_000553 [Serendipita sp. 399]|nr:hypothetical protein FRC17_000553 [Serendipita sp. 399]
MSNDANTLFMAKRSLGFALIDVEFIQRHDALRPLDNGHVATLIASLEASPNSHHAYPLHVVPLSGVDDTWLDRLQQERLLLDHDEHARFVCIGGGHRLQAAKQIQREEMKWLCEVYSSVDDVDEDMLRAWMSSFNIERPRMCVTFADTLRVIYNAPADRRPQLGVVMGWSAKDAKSISVALEILGEEMMALIDSSWLENLAKSTIVDWSTAFMLYPFLRCVLQDVLLLHRNVFSLFDVTLSHRLLLGDHYRTDHTQSKHGTYENLSKRWQRMRDQPPYADLPSIANIWSECIEKQTTSLCFGEMLPTEYDLNFTTGNGPLFIRLVKAHHIASLLHLITSPLSLTDIPMRRPKRGRLDWETVLMESGVTKREGRDEILRYILCHADALLATNQAWKDWKAVKSILLPHASFIIDDADDGFDEALLRTTLARTLTPVWEELLALCRVHGLEENVGMSCVREEEAEEASGDGGSWDNASQGISALQENEVQQVGMQKQVDLAVSAGLGQKRKRHGNEERRALMRRERFTSHSMADAEEIKGPLRNTMQTLLCASDHMSEQAWQETLSGFDPRHVSSALELVLGLLEAVRSNPQ